MKRMERRGPVAAAAVCGILMLCNGAGAAGATQSAAPATPEHPQQLQLPGKAMQAGDRDVWAAKPAQPEAP